jgi:hypothetical protein
MKCEWVRQNILFYVYNELEDDARYEVEQHVGRCPQCATELKAARKFHATLSEMQVAEPTPNLLTASRMRCRRSAETTQPGGITAADSEPGAAAAIRWRRAGGGDFHRFGGGIGATYNFLANRSPITDISNDDVGSPSRLRRLHRSVTQKPGSSW